MQRVLKWAGYGLAGVVGACALAVGGAFTVSEAMIRWPAETPRVTLVASSDAGAVERGARVAKLNGCHDCHGSKLEGRLFHDEMPIIRAWAPNLSLALKDQTDADFDRSIRHGVAPAGGKPGFSPPKASAHPPDRRMASLMAYCAPSRPTGGRQRAFRWVPTGRPGGLRGRFKREPAMIKANGA